MAPNGEIDPLWYVLLPERTGERNSRFDLLLISVLMKNKNHKILLKISPGFLELSLARLKQIIENGVLDIPEPIERNLSLTIALGDEQWSYDYFVQAELLAEVVQIVALMQQIAYADLTELIIGVVVVSVDGEDRQ